MNCEYCEKEHNGFYGSGRFCSNVCARKFSTKNDNKNELKKSLCINCGKEIAINKRKSHKFAKCDDCINRCNTCGQSKCLRPDICKRKQLLTGTLHLYFGFDIDTLDSLDVYKEFDRIRDKILDMYSDHSLSEMCDVVGYKSGANNLWNNLKFLKIPYRTLSEANHKYRMEHDVRLPTSTRYKTGWHTTWEGKQIFYRSSYELDYCNELDEKKIKYEVESLRFEYWDSMKQKYRIAIPDFYLSDINKLVEIKSKWTYEEQNMKDKFNAYKQRGYNTELILDHKITKI